MNDQMLRDSEGGTAVLEAPEVIDAPEAFEPAVKGHDHAEPKHRCGYGACSSSGCFCQAYSGSAYTCANCGHNYATHW